MGGRTEQAAVRNVRQADELKKQGASCYPPEFLASYFERYDAIVSEGLEANPVRETPKGKRGRKAKGKIRCLLERLRGYKDDILRFAVDWSVPFPLIIECAVSMGCSAEPTVTSTAPPRSVMTGTCYSPDASVVLGRSSAIPASAGIPLSPIRISPLLFS